MRRASVEGFTQTGEKTSTFDETWTPVWGENKTIRNHYKELLVNLIQEKTGRVMNLRSVYMTRASACATSSHRRAVS